MPFNSCFEPCCCCEKCKSHCCNDDDECKPFNSSQTSVVTQQPKDPNRLDLLLVGVTGSGISSVCKTIAESSTAYSQGGFSSVTEGVETGNTEFEELTINVVAAPGVRESSKRSQEKYFKSILAKSFQHSPTGFNAVVLVVSYNHRITMEFKQTMDNLQSVLGKNTLSESGVLMLTGVDNLIRDLSGEKTVGEWVNEQKGYIKELIGDCGQRCVMFDNVTDIKEVKESQIKRLVAEVQRTSKVFQRKL